MDKIISDILDQLRSGRELDGKRLAAIIHAHNRELEPGKRHYSKKRLLPYYFKEKRAVSELWRSWGVDDELEAKLIATLRVKPRRTESGVATITVITKPWPCRGNCIFCPNDLRMPKSYLHDEPACQRAERVFFDPYLQVVARLRALSEMGHPTDKIELIVLGGTWSDYPQSYRIWFVEQLFRALNDPREVALGRARERKGAYRSAGLSNAPEALEGLVAAEQSRIDSGMATYSEGFEALYAATGWSEVSRWQSATFEQLSEQQRINETAAHRAVGLVVETRPDLIDADSLIELRRLGCTKVQIGVQSLDENVLAQNGRSIEIKRIARSFELLRLMGYKIHTHFMVNLYGSTPDADIADYERFVSDPRFMPDEVKLYPCVLVEGSALGKLYESGRWVPYTSEELEGILLADMMATPRFTRVSRMIRDISAVDIIAGNKRANLRQLIDARAEERGVRFVEMRSREVAGDDPSIEELELRETEYATSATDEIFLEWVTPQDSIAGFCRLSLPRREALEALGGELPIAPGEAMIRELHVYGKTARLGISEGAQHLGLGRRLLERACDIAAQRGYGAIRVISSIGTREYYRNLGFADGELYQRKELGGFDR